MRGLNDEAQEVLIEERARPLPLAWWSAKRRRWYLISLFGIALAFLFTRARADVGDPVSRVVCVADYAPTVFAEGMAAPDGLAMNADAVLYVAEEKAGRVSRVDSYGRVTTVLENLRSPEGITFDSDGNLYVVEDVAGGRVIKMTTAGVTTTLVAERDAPEGIAWAPDDTLYITESNVQFALNPLSFRTHVTAISPGGGATRILTDTRVRSYAGITTGLDGLLYVTNEASGTGTSDSILSVDPVTGLRSLFASGLVAPEGLHFSANGGFPLYVAEEDTGGGVGRLSRVEADGSHTTLCTGFSSIEDVLVNQDGALYVSEDGTGSIIRIEPSAVDRRRPAALILFIGDGMGEAHRIAGRWSAVGQTGALALDAMPFGGWSRTASADNAITDSAAAATAMATGVKTNNGVIGLDPAGNRLLTILERAQAHEMAVGLVTNVHLTHATPAGFAAHVPHRSMMREIASQMLESGVNVLLGGGEDEFLPTTAAGCYPESGERSDGRNLIDEAIGAGYSYVCDAPGLMAVTPFSTTHLLGLFADEEMDRPFSPSLADMTQKAIDILSQDPDGFFLMVEGGQIDWAAHDNEAANVISDTVGLDEAIAVARAYASTASDVLIIVTADHETGGMQVALTSSGGPGEDGPFFTPEGTPFFVNWTTVGHTGVDVPTTAQGPWSDLLTGVYDNTHIHEVMRLSLERARLYVPLLLRSLRTQGLALNRR
jgi:alkaline phosphatase